MPTSSAASGVEYVVSPRRKSLKNVTDSIERNGKTNANGRDKLRRSSSSQEIKNEELLKENGDEQRVDKNLNLLTVKQGRRRMVRRRSSTSGTLLAQNEADKTDAPNGKLNIRRSPTSISNPSSPRRGSSSSLSFPQQQQSLSPRRINSGMKFTRRNSSNSANILSPTNRPDVYFEYAIPRKESFECTKNEFLKGGLIMIDKCSIRCLEYMNEKEKKEVEKIDEKLERIRAEKQHLDILQTAVLEWIALLKEIHRLSKGVPLIRSITKVCLAMNDVFTANGGAYGASLLALRRCGLPTVNQLSADMERLRAKIEKGGQELTVVDGKYLEDIREMLGRLQGTLTITLKMLY